MKKVSTLLFKSREMKKQLPQWPLYSCKNIPKTLSFRGAAANGDDGEMFKTVNSVFLDDPLLLAAPSSPAAATAAHGAGETPESLFTNSAESTSLSTESFEEYYEPLESLISKVVRSDRMFFEPAGNTKFILEEEAKTAATPTTSNTSSSASRRGGSGGGGQFGFIKESVAMAIDSEDPYADFKKSMEEMVESHGLTDWECLEELLGWYLKVNAKDSHGFIIGAFVDLLVTLSSSSSNNCCISTSESITCYSSAVSSLSSPSSSPSFSSVIGVIDRTTTGLNLR